MYTKKLRMAPFSYKHESFATCLKENGWIVNILRNIDNWHNFCGMWKKFVPLESMRVLSSHFSFALMNDILALTIFFSPILILVFFTRWLLQQTFLLDNFSRLLDELELHHSTFKRSTYQYPKLFCGKKKNLPKNTR